MTWFYDDDDDDDDRILGRRGIVSQGMRGG